MRAACRLEPNAVLTQRIEVAPGLAILRVPPAGWTLPPFTPGQLAVLGLPASAPRTRADPRRALLVTAAPRTHGRCGMMPGAEGTDARRMLVLPPHDRR